MSDSRYIIKIIYNEPLSQDLQLHVAYALVCWCNHAQCVAAVTQGEHQPSSSLAVVQCVTMFSAHVFVMEAYNCNCGLIACTRMQGYQ